MPEIAAITSHSLKDMEAILDAHDLGGRVELAEAAVMELNAVSAWWTERRGKKNSQPSPDRVFGSPPETS
ncbi:hypothetical protein ACFQU1_05835 [Chelatococcus sp. GCM10030263]|uniref:hypothetical protein n=1 Tax=Chelatococcus sp. GCM10030263 TaxID=3273387 RepID=UPI00361BE1F0